MRPREALRATGIAWRAAACAAALVVVAAQAGGRPASAAAAPPKLKTIGVLGGIGPQATMDFEARVHRQSQQRLPQMYNSGYPPMVVLFHRRPPILLAEDGSPQKPVRLDPVLAVSLPKLGAMVDFLVITSNGAHLVQAQVEEASGRPVLSMIEVTLAETRRRGWKRVGVIGMGDPTVYTDRLAAAGVAFETLPPELRHALDGVMLRFMAGESNAETVRLAEEAIATLRGRKIDGVILGCSELPLILGGKADAADLVNPIAVLAAAAVERAQK
jgi:aspartate racemase